MIRAAFEKGAEGLTYPACPPFDPPEFYPEFRRANLCFGQDPSNAVYPLVRSLLRRLRLDEENYGTDRWNPLGGFVGPGQRVLIKPNLVHHAHPKGPSALPWMVSHPSIIRALLDYALLAVGPKGSVVIGDTPVENCDFTALCRTIGLDELVATVRQRGVAVSLLDFRTYMTTQHPDATTSRTELSGDPSGYTDIDLGRDSYLQELEDERGPQNYYTLGDHSVDHFDPKSRRPGLPNNFHSSGRHLYRIPNTVLDSDCIINVAKLKTHKFAGVSLSLKNAIGICQGKEFLPHRRPGTPQEGGDSFATYPSARFVGTLRLKRMIYRTLGGTVGSRIARLNQRLRGARLPHEVRLEPLYGDWYGNDTIWRTTLDLSLVLLHADRESFELSRRRRPVLSVIDGIIGMDHEAPMTGLPVCSNLVVGGLDSVAADTLGCFLMGLDPRKIPTIARAGAGRGGHLGSPTLRREETDGPVAVEMARTPFAPTKGWAESLCGPLESWPF